MKKRPLIILSIITLLFCTFTLGFFLGRNQNRDSIQVSVLSTRPVHNAAPFIPESEPDPAEDSVTFPININTATQEQLTQLPGIGETMAKRILTYRTYNGNFSKPEELLNVEGIGSGKLEAILDYVTTGG